MKKIDMLVFKTDSFDTDCLIEDVINYSSNSIILVLSFDGKIKVQWKPPDIKLDLNVSGLFRFKNPKLNTYLLPLLVVFDILTYSRLLFVLCLKYRPKVCWIENTYAALIMGIMKKFGLCGKVIYLPGDWLVSNKENKRLSSYLDGLVFVIADYLSCKMNDMVLDCTEKITEARYKFWGKKISKKGGLYSFDMQIKAINSYDDKKRTTMCFLGNVRKDSGLDIVIKSLAKIRERQDIILKIIGPESLNSEYLKKIVKKYNVEPYVKFLGFVERDKLAEVLSDCFCGLNLLTDLNSYSSYTIPGKIIHYLQFLLPVVTTEGAGVVTSVIADNKLGLIIEPSQEVFIGAILELYARQRQYRDNIINYINSSSKIDFEKIIADVTCS